MSTPFSGKQFTFTQPDGSELWVKGWGNQRQAVFECLNGYTVVKDPITGFYVYAELSSDGEELIPTGIRPRITKTEKLGEDKLGLVKGVRVKLEAAKAKAQESGLPNRGSRWEERRKQFKSGLHGAAAAPGISAAPPTRQTIGDFTGLCLLIQFPDVPGTITREEVDDFCNKIGYNGFGNNGSVYDYFYAVSGGRLRYKNIVTPYYMAKHPRSYYTNEAIPQGDRARELIKEALSHLKTQGFDFSKLTADEMGYLYATNVFYAGSCSNNWAKGLWPHQSSMLIPYELIPGKSTHDYQITDMSSELSLGTFCHENGHMICDFPDLYDYGKESAGVGQFCLMCMGGNINPKNPAHINPYLKYKAGWAKSAINITPGLSVTIQAETNQFFIHRKASAPTEYYIIENRSNSGRDAALPGSGLVIWHIDELGNNQYEHMNSLYHYECSVVQADGRNDLEYSSYPYGDATDLFGAGINDHFGETTNPSSKWWDGTPSGLNIKEIGSIGTMMTFKAAEQDVSTLIETQDQGNPTYTVTVVTERNLREGTSTSTKTTQTLKGIHTLTGDVLWTASTAQPTAEQKVGDQWLHITAVDGFPVSSRYLAVIHNGQVYSKPKRIHRVASKENLTTLAEKYHTTVDKLVAENKLAYPGLLTNKNLVEIGWELKIPD